MGCGKPFAVVESPSVPPSLAHNRAPSRCTPFPFYSIHHGEDSKTGKHVAIKIMDKERLEQHKLMECVSREVGRRQ